jgi:hypothetical protein
VKVLRAVNERAAGASAPGRGLRRLAPKRGLSRTLGGPRSERATRPRCAASRRRLRRSPLPQSQHGGDGIGEPQPRRSRPPVRPHIRLVRGSLGRSLTGTEGSRPAPTSRAGDTSVDYLLRAQRGDGGFGQRSDQTSNAQSTSWAVQGLVAVGGERRATAVRDALSFLRSLQASDGSIHYSQQSNQTPVWVTGQALLALARQPLPVQDRRPRS